MILTGDLHDLARDTVVTNAELLAQVAARADHIRPHLRPERRMVLLPGSSSIAFFVDLFAIWAAGGCAVSLNPGLTQPELERIAGFVRPALMVGDDARAEAVGLRGGASQTGSAPLRTDLDDPALILFTSGSTGAPKGVVLTPRALLARLALNAAHIGDNTLARTLCVLPTHFGHGLIGGCLTALARGGRVYLAPTGGLETVSQLNQIIDDHELRFLTSVPGFWKLALRLAPPPQRGSLRRVSVGSAPLAPDHWRAIQSWSGAAVWNMYGLTETANWVGGTPTPATGALGTLWGGAAAVLGADGKTTREGEGALLLQTPSLMQGYFNRPDLTDEALQDGWLNTGDIGVISPGGEITLKGRSKYVINIDGTKIYPEEIDQFFETHPQIVEAVSVALPDPASGERLALAFVPTTPVSPKELQAWAKPRLRPEAIPSRFVEVAEIPKCPRGKVKRADVQVLLQGGAA